MPGETRVASMKAVGAHQFVFKEFFDAEQLMHADRGLNMGQVVLNVGQYVVNTASIQCAQIHIEGPGGILDKHRNDSKAIP